MSMPASALAAPQPFPAPMGFPSPQPDPQTFGLSPADQMTMSSTGLYLPPPTQVQTAAAAAQPQTYAELMGTALGATGDTAAMTLPEAQAQTDRALARIQSVNPEVAAQLSAARGDQPEGDKGFWGTIMGFVAASPIGKALELMSRPAHIIPEILSDGEDSVWKNIGDALTGNSTATWSTVLEKTGLLQGDDWMSRIARTTVSFGMDMATDPMTYMFMGAGAVGRTMVAKFGGELAAKAVLFEEGGSILGRYGEMVGKEALGFEAAQAVTEEEMRSAAFKHLWKRATSAGPSKASLGKMESLAEQLKVVDPDFTGGLLGQALRDGDEQVVLHAMDAANEMHKVVGKFGLRGLGDNLAEELGIPKEAVMALLKDTKTVGMFGKKEAYLQAKYAAALKGGIRFGVPGVRVLTPAVWGTNRLDFSIARRFFSGLSGQTRILRAIESGAIEPQIGRAMLEAATDGGWKGVLEHVPQAATMFQGHGGRLGTAFAKASWQVGGITRNLGSFAVVRGGGLGAALSADARKQMNVVKASFEQHARTYSDEVLRRQDEVGLVQEIADLGVKHDVIGDISKRGTGEMNPAEVQRTFHYLDRTVTEATGDPTTIIRGLEAFPTAAAQRGGATAYYDQLAADIIARGGDNVDALLARNEVRRKVALGIEDQIKDHPELGLAMRMYRVTANETHDMYNEFGLHAANSSVKTESQQVIHPGNREDVETGHAASKGKDFQYVQDVESSADGPGPQLSYVTDTDQGRGHLLEEIPSDQPQRAVGLTGKLQDRSGKVLGDIPESEVTWMRTKDLVDNVDTKIPREAGAAPREGYDVSLQDQIRAEGYDKPIEATYNPETGRTEITDGNHHLAAADAMGEEYVPVRTVLPAEGETLQERARATLMPSEKPLTELQPDKFHGIPVAERSGKKRVAIGMKNPVYVNKDAAAMMARGERPITGAELVDPIAQAEEFAAKMMEMADQKWDPVIQKILNSPKFSAKSKEVQQILTSLGLHPQGMSDQFARTMLESKAARVARIKTQFLQDLGYDGVLTQENGRLTALVFEDGLKTGKKTPVWELSEAAVANHADLGFYHRTLEPWVIKALDGTLPASERSAKKDWDAALVRQTHNMTFDEAEQHVRQQLAERGIQVTPEQAIFGRDAAANLNQYVAGATNDVGNAFLGREAKRLQALGFTRSPFASGYVGPLYEGTPSAAYTGGWLKQQSEKLWTAAQTAAKNQTNIAKKAAVEGRKIESTLHNLNERLHGVIDDEMAKTERAVAKARMPAGESMVRDPKFMREEVKKWERISRSSSDPVEDLGNGVYRQRTGKGGALYFTKDEAGNMTSFRGRSANGDTWTSRLPEDKYKQITDKLLDADMKDRGVTDIVAFRKDIKKAGVNSLSPGGAEARLRYAREHLATPEKLKPGLVKQVRAREAELDALRRKQYWRTNTMLDVTEEWNKILFEAQAKAAEPKVALHIGDPNHIGMSPLQVPGLEEMYMPSTMADEFNHAAAGFKHLNEFQKSWRQMLSWWKEWATWSWPGFHVRNMMGGWFNNWLGGVEMRDYMEVGRAMRARREIERGGEKTKYSSMPLSKEFINRHGLSDYYFGTNPTYADLATMFSNNGINSASGRSFGEARVASELYDKDMAKPANSPLTMLDRIPGIPSFVGKPGRVAARSMRTTGEMTENVLRGAAFLQGLKQTGGDFGSAHLFTMMRHGDYSDLTDWEYGAIRDVIPFYKWMRTNTPLQIHQLFERPAHLMMMLHAKDAAFELTGVDVDEARSKMPGWAMQGLVFPMPGSTNDAINLVTADLPMNDLYQGAGEFISQMLPLARPFLESYVIDKSLFSGKPIEGSPVKVDLPFINGPIGHLLSSMNIGKIGADGDYYIDDKLQNVLGVIPLVARFRPWLYEEPSRMKSRVPMLISAAAGVGIKNYGEQEFTSEELNFYYSNVVPQLEYMKKMGYPLPSTDDLQAMYGATNNYLTAAGIDPREGI